MVKPPPKAKSKLEESIEIAEWPGNSRGQTIRVRSRSYGGHPLLDIRTWWTGDDGAVRPGKGFSCRLKDLPRPLHRPLRRGPEAGQDTRPRLADESEGSE
jgi:Transcriptional Coactivator p15 (PC4)